MQANKVLILSLVVASLLSGCGLTQMPVTTAEPVRLMSQPVSLAAFSKIAVTAPIDLQVQVNPNLSANQATIMGEPNAVAPLALIVKQQVLYLSIKNSKDSKVIESIKGIKGIKENSLGVKLPQSKAGLPLVKLQVPSLTQVDYRAPGNLSIQGAMQAPLDLTISKAHTVRLAGSTVNLHRLQVADQADVNIQGINSLALAITISGAPKVTLAGVANVGTINDSSSGHLNLTWVNSQTLRIRASGTGHIFLAGVAQLLDAQLQQASVVDARYLRVPKAYVATTDNARLGITVIDNLNALASGNSTIYYYYQKPALLSQYLRQQGAVLFMGNLPPCKSLPFGLKPMDAAG